MVAVGGWTDGRRRRRNRRQVISFTSAIHLRRRRGVLDKAISIASPQALLGVSASRRPLSASDACTLLYFSFCLSHLLQIIGNNVLDERQER